MVKNLGALTNKGFEFVLNTDNLVGQFKWKTSLNFSTNKNKITDLQDQVSEAGLNNMSRAVVGEALGTFLLWNMPELTLQMAMLYGIRILKIQMVHSTDPPPMFTARHKGL